MYIIHVHVDVAKRISSFRQKHRKVKYPENCLPTVMIEIFLENVMLYLAIHSLQLPTLIIKLPLLALCFSQLYAKIR